MLRNYLQSAIRNLIKRKFYSLISIGGLSLGIIAFLLIGMYVWNEKSYDQFHIRKNQIFRIQEDSYAHGVIEESLAGVGAAVGVDLKDAFPEIHRFVRLRRNQVMLSSGDVMFRENKVLFASEDFFTVFSFQLLKGVDTLVLRRPFTMVVSESFGRKYFGEADPLGKTLRNNGGYNYEITGVFKDVPENTHLQVDALFSFNSLYPIFGPDNTQYLTNWGWVGYPTYIELYPNADPKEFAAKLPAFIDSKMGVSLRESDGKIVFNLQSLTSIHLNSNFNNEVGPNGDGRSVDFLSLIAILILAMAWINYISLATARSMERAKEIGVRKVLGGNRGQVIRQFLLESLLCNFIAAIISAVLVMLFVPYFSTLVNRHFDPKIFEELEVYLLLSALFIIAVVCSGLYPAFVMSGFTIEKVLKGQFKTSVSGNFLRRGLVIVQFVTSIVLIAGTYIVFKQVKFMEDSSLGVDISQTLVVEAPTVTDSSYNNNVNQFRNELLRYPDVKMLATSSAVPGRATRNGAGGVRITTQSEKSAHSCDVLYVDEEFLRAYSLELLTGRNFSHEYHDHAKSAILNESALQLIDFSDPEKILGEKILVYGDTLSIVGIINDYHQQSLKVSMEPLIFICDNLSASYYSIKIDTRQSMVDMIGKAETAFERAFPGNPFNYFFLDDYYNEQYKSEQQFGNIFILFTIIGIVIACLGLFGLSSYLVSHRAKEIGIRKILGASLRQILVLVSREFIALVLIANIIACPIYYWLMTNWLNGFANRISIGVLSFVIPAIVALVVAILTVASQSLKAASANPVESLKSE